MKTRRIGRSTEISGTNFNVRSTTLPFTLLGDSEIGFEIFMMPYCDTLKSNSRIFSCGLLVSMCVPWYWITTDEEQSVAQELWWLQIGVCEAIAIQYTASLWLQDSKLRLGNRKIKRPFISYKALNIPGQWNKCEADVWRGHELFVRSAAVYASLFCTAVTQLRYVALIQIHSIVGSVRSNVTIENHAIIFVSSVNNDQVSSAVTKAGSVREMVENDRDEDIPLRRDMSRHRKAEKNVFVYNRRQI